MEETLFIALALKRIFFNLKRIALAHGNSKSTLDFRKVFTHFSGICFQCRDDVLGNELALIAFHRTATLSNNSNKASSTLTQLFDLHEFIIQARGTTSSEFFLGGTNINFKRAHQFTQFTL